MANINTSGETIFKLKYDHLLIHTIIRTNYSLINNIYMRRTLWSKYQVLSTFVIGVQQNTDGKYFRKSILSLLEAEKGETHPEATRKVFKSSVVSNCLYWNLIYNKGRIKTMVKRKKKNLLNSTPYLEYLG